MELTDREHEVVAQVYDEDIPRNLHEVETELLIAMHDRVTDAVQLSYEDDDMESLGILLPLEGKVAQALHQRL